MIGSHFMKPRARRVVLGAAALVAVLVAVVVAANWGTVRDHVEAWHFQLTRETTSIHPDGVDADAYQTHDLGATAHVREHVRDLARALRCPVIFDSNDAELLPQCIFTVYECCVPPTPNSRESFLAFLKEERGYCIIEQRFPRRAYVVIRADR